MPELPEVETVVRTLRPQVLECCIERVDVLSEDVLASAGGAGTERGTGGMEAKLHAAALACEAGIPMFIMNGHDPDILYRLLDGERVGTYFTVRK